MLIDLLCARCGRSVWLTWTVYLDAVASGSPRRNWPYVCGRCRTPDAFEPPAENPR
jgi:hypothetical protein